MARPLTRRMLLADLGRWTLGAVVLGVGAACASETTTDGDAATGTDPTDPVADETATEAPTATATESPVAAEGVGGTAWRRVDLDFVSAYVLVQGGEAVLVDTGVEGSEGAIEATLTAAGSSWSDVAHVILTHRHPDHIGGLPAVMAAATAAAAYTGAEDVAATRSPREVQPLADGDTVAGLTIVATPGHTPGHISVLDPMARLLLAGDALNGTGTGVTGPNEQFTPDMPTAWDSVEKLGSLDFDTAVFGHGSPVVGDAAAQVAALQRS